MRFTSYESSDMRLIAFPSREIYVFAVVVASVSRVYISERHGPPRGLGSVSVSTADATDSEGSLPWDEL